LLIETGTGMGESYLDRYRGVEHGYVERADAAIVRDVRAALQAHPELDARRLDVEALHDEVTLRGSVHTTAMRSLAVELARAVPGVAFVHDLLTLHETDA
jgi:osmotically-inducible protein OsmY